MFYNITNDATLNKADVFVLNVGNLQVTFIHSLIFLQITITITDYKASAKKSRMFRNPVSRSKVPDPEQWLPHCTRKRIESNKRAKKNFNLSTVFNKNKN